MDLKTALGEPETEDVFVAGIEDLVMLQDDLIDLESEIEAGLEDIEAAIPVQVSLMDYGRSLEDPDQASNIEELRETLRAQGIDPDSLPLEGGVEGIADMVAKIGRGIGDGLSNIVKKGRDFRRAHLTALGINKKNIDKLIQQLKKVENVPSTVQVGVAASKVTSTDFKASSVKDISKAVDEYNDFMVAVYDKWMPTYEKQIESIADTMMDTRFSDVRGSIMAIIDEVHDLPMHDLVKLTGAKKGAALTGRRSGYGSKVWPGQMQLVVDVGSEKKSQKEYQENLRELMTQAISRQAYFSKVKWPNKKPIELRLAVNSRDDVVKMLETMSGMLGYAIKQMDRDTAQGFGDNLTKTYMKMLTGDAKAWFGSALIGKDYVEYLRMYPRVMVWQQKPRNSIIKHTATIASGVARIGRECLK